MRPATALATLAFLALLVSAASAAYVITPDVVASGGGESSGPGYSVIGTVGQSAIGIATGPSYINEIGFWYQPQWVLTDVEEEKPLTFGLGQNFPNPFNPVTVFRYSVPHRTRVTLRLYDVAGREVRTLVDAEREPGYHTTVVNAAGLSSGVYFCRMVAGTYTESRKLTLLK